MKDTVSLGVESTYLKGPHALGATLGLDGGSIVYALILECGLPYLEKGSL